MKIQKYTNKKFHENPSSWSQVVPFGRTDRQADVTKLIVDFRNFVNAPKNYSQLFKQFGGSVILISVPRPAREPAHKYFGAHGLEETFRLRV